MVFMLAIDFHYVTLCGIPIPYSDNAVHLGCFVGNGSNQLNVKKATQDLYGQHAPVQFFPMFPGHQVLFAPCLLHIILWMPLVGPT